MFRRLVWSALLVGAAGLVVKSALPDLNRYLRIRAM